MVSSVAIDDQLRQKLKILAAKYDTTQAEIIKRALALLETSEDINMNMDSDLVIKELKNASITVYDQDPRRKDIAQKLSRPGIDIDDLRMTFND